MVSNVHLEVQGQVPILEIPKLFLAHSHDHLDHLDDPCVTKLVIGFTGKGKCGKGGKGKGKSYLHHTLGKGKGEGKGSSPTKW